MLSSIFRDVSVTHISDRIAQTAFAGDESVDVDGVKARLLFARSYADILELIRDSYENWRTRQYDWFQQTTNGIQS
jgi:hypothetical protein